MGEDVVEPFKGDRLPKHLGGLTWDTFPNYIRDKYGLGTEQDVMELIEQLDGTLMRDQREPDATLTANDRRLSLHASAKTIRAEAAKRHPDQPRLRNALAAFEKAIEPDNWSAVMLYEVFDIPFIPSTEVDTPEVFDALRHAMAARTSGLNKVAIDMEALSRLPVRERLRTNKVRNHALEQALLACREFWLTHSKDLGWSRSEMSQPDTLQRNDRTQLVGPCERFVVDVITASGIKFTLRKLNGAWSALDKRLGKT